MSDSDNDSEYYNVEKIVAKDKNEMRYLVKWENYPMNQCIWEPEENLKNVQQLLQEFEKNKNENESVNSNDVFQKKKRGRPKKIYKSDDDDYDDKSENQISSRKLEKNKNDTHYKHEEKTNYTISNKGIDVDYENDTPLKVVSLTKVDGDLYFLTKWKVRNNGITPDDCLIKNSFFKEKFPKILVEYYETRIRFTTKNN